MQFSQSHAPRNYAVRYSKALPTGYAFVMDFDGVTYLTDTNDVRLVVYVG